MGTLSDLFFFFFFFFFLYFFFLPSLSRRRSPPLLLCSLQLTWPSPSVVICFERHWPIVEGEEFPSRTGGGGGEVARKQGEKEREEAFF